MKLKIKKGFTLIELLVVIAIIGILASVIMASLSSSSNKAKVVATKKSLSSLRASIAACCSSSNASLVGGIGAEICSPEIGSIAPNATQLKVDNVIYSSSANCNSSDPGFIVSLYGHPVSACNASNGYWTVTQSKIIAPTGCGSVASVPQGGEDEEAN